MRDLSNAKLSIEPVDSTSWSDDRTDLIAEAKNKLRADLEIELAAAPSEEDVESLRAAFSSRERRLEHDVDSKIHTFSATVDVEVQNERLNLTNILSTQKQSSPRVPFGPFAQYNFLAK